MYSLVFVRMDLYLDTGCMYFSTDITWSQHRPIHSRCIRCYSCVSICIRQYGKGLDFWILTECIFTFAIQTNPFTLYSLVFVCIDRYSSVWKGPDLYSDTDCMYFNTVSIQSQYRPIHSRCIRWYSCVSMCIRQYGTGPDLYLGTDCMFFRR